MIVLTATYWPHLVLITVKKKNKYRGRVEPWLVFTWFCESVFRLQYESVLVIFG